MPTFVQFMTPSKKKLSINVEAIEWIEEVGDNETHIKIADRTASAIVSASFKDVVKSTGGTNFDSRLSLASF